MNNKETQSYELNIEWMLLLQDALIKKEWNDEAAVINYVNRISETKLTNPTDINAALVIISKQMKYNYPLRCFLKEEGDKEHETI